MGGATGEQLPPHTQQKDPLTCPPILESILVSALTKSLKVVKKSILRLCKNINCNIFKWNLAFFSLFHLIFQIKCSGSAPEYNTSYQHKANSNLSS